MQKAPAVFGELKEPRHATVFAADGLANAAGDIWVVFVGIDETGFSGVSFGVSFTFPQRSDYIFTLMYQGHGAWQCGVSPQSYSHKGIVVSPSCPEASLAQSEHATENVV